MENDNLILTEIEQDELIENEVEDGRYEEEDNSFEISEEAKERSRKFFNFGQKAKKEKRKFESFEIVKTYTPKEKVKKEDEFDKILEVSNDMQTSEDSISVKSTNKDQKVKVQLRPQGKLILATISIIIILLASVLIHNAVTLNSLNKNIDNLNNQITVEDLKIDKAVKNLETLSDEAKSSDKALELELEKATSVEEVELYVRQDTPTTSEITNWFDKLCNFVSKIFGG